MKAKFDPIPFDYSAELASVISWMLMKNPKDRPSCEELLESQQVKTWNERLDNSPLKKWEESLKKEMLMTIWVPMNLKNLDTRLPRPKYSKQVLPFIKMKKTKIMWPTNSQKQSLNVSKISALNKWNSMDQRWEKPHGEPSVQTSLNSSPQRMIEIPKINGR